MTSLSPHSEVRPRVLATDLDGTLIPLAGNERNRKDLAVLERQLERGQVTLTFVTGRHLAIVQDAMQEHRLPRPDWIICDVGTTIYWESPHGWKRLAAYHEHLSGICGSLPIRQLREHLSAFKGLTLQDDEKQGDFKLSFYVDQRKLSAVTDRLSHWLADRDAPYSLISSVDPFTGRGLIDLLPRDVSKASAIAWWCDDCGFEKTQVVFAGDSGNDWAALVAGYRSIVVGNADRELAARVKQHHDEQGWTDRLHLAGAPATSGVLEGCRAFGLFKQHSSRLTLGATPLPGPRTQFAVWAPQSDRVDVQVESDENVACYPLEPIGDGYFQGVVDGVGPGARYAFRLDQHLARPDPLSRYQPDSVHGLSQVVDPQAYHWQDNDWTGIPKAELILYEVHIGAFTAAGTFPAAIERLSDLRQLGITAVEIMPLAQAPGRWNWGYDGVGLFAANNNYGTPDDFRAFVEAAHAAGLAVILDVVYNHVGPEGNYLAEFGPYFSTTHHTPWGEAFNFDGPDSRPVRQFIVENALRWLEEYHLDGLRLDAVHCMGDKSDEPILDAIRVAVTDYAATVTRPIHLIAETNVYDERLLRPSADGHDPYDAIWCDDIMYALYSHVAPEVKHTLRPYRGAADLAESLQHGCLYTWPPERRITRAERDRRNPDGTGDDLASFVIALQNHDVVGNDPHGRRLHQLTSPRTQKAAAALILLYPAIPLLFMGEEFAAASPFRFFADFGDEHLRQAVELGRAREYPAHERTLFVSPLDPRAFAESKLSTDRDESMLEWYRALLRVRKQWRSDGCLSAKWLTVNQLPHFGVFTLQYGDVDKPSRFVIVRLRSEDSGDSMVRVALDGAVLLDSMQSFVGSLATAEPLVLAVDQALVGTGDFQISPSP